MTLTDTQLLIVKQRAKTIPQTWRSQFLNLVADELVPLQEITDQAVAKAADTVLAKMFSGGGSQCCE